MVAPFLLRCHDQSGWDQSPQMTFAQSSWTFLARVPKRAITN
jgi:hypothetical protein